VLGLRLRGCSPPTVCDVRRHRQGKSSLSGLPHPLERADRCKASKELADEFPHRGKENALRIRALVLLLRYSGMRIGDAVSLSADRINGNRLFLYTAKTGTPVNTILPDFVLEALDACPKVTDVYFFWNGRDKLDTVVSSAWPPKRADYRAPLLALGTRSSRAT
jgi:integrase